MRSISHAVHPAFRWLGTTAAYGCGPKPPRSVPPGGRAELELSREKYETARRAAESRMKEIEKQETLLKKLRAEGNEHDFHF